MPGRNVKPKLVIIGASGQGKVVADIARLDGYKDIVFLDDNEDIKKCSGFPVVGKTSDAESIDGVLFVAIGNAKKRQQLMEKYRDREQPVLVHPNAVIACDVEIGEGSVVMAGAVINTGATIGRGVIVNTSSSIDHDCVIGDYVHVAVGAHICGNVLVGNMTWIGASATIIQGIKIGSEVMIGAGAVVVRDVLAVGMYVGVPAKMVKGGKE